MQQRTRLAAAAAFGALLFLSACDTKPETVVAGSNDPNAAEVAAAPKVTLPPAIKDSRTYRCKDESLVYVDFLSDGLTANFKTAKDGVATTLTAPEPGKPFVAEGYSVSTNAPVTEIAAPGKGAQTCKA